jgi:hypothetical protein
MNSKNYGTESIVYFLHFKKFMDVKLAPIWSVKTGGAFISLARFADGSVAAAVKTTGAGKSIYSAPRAVPRIFEEYPERFGSPPVP